MLSARAKDDPITAEALGIAAERRRVSWPTIMLGIGFFDLLALSAAFALAYLVRFGVDLPIFREAPSKVDFYTLVVGWALPVWVVIFLFCRLYDHRYLFAGFDEYMRVAVGCTVGVLAIIVISFFYDMQSIARAWLIMVWLASMILVGATRFLIRRAIWQAREHGYLLRRSVVVGANEEGRVLASHLTAMPFSGMQVVGFVDDSASGEIEGLPVLATVGGLEALIDSAGIQEMVIATTSIGRQELLDLYRRFGHDQRVELRLSSGLFEILTTGVRVQEVGGLPLMTLHRVRITGMDAILKSALDIVGTSLALLLLGPVMLAVALIVRLDNPGPILFRRRVLGRNGTTFHALKFCTMIPDRRKRSAPFAFPDRRLTDKSENDPRVTRIGRFLRRTSLDELPQLLNVLRGEMSLVGPRMISPDELSRFGTWHVNLLTVKPGITGPWQVSGRAAIPYEERVRLNMEYIRHYSIWRDLEILLRTIPAVVRGNGAF